MTPADTPTVRVGIVSWNTADLLQRCLAAVPRALGDLEAEVVVVDNASTDASVAAARSFANVDVIENAENVGYAAGMNQALAGAEAEVLIALNPDTEPPPGSLATLVERLLAEDALGLVAPRLVHADGSLQHSAYRFPSAAVALAVSFLPRVVLATGLGERMGLEGWSPHERADDIDWAIGAVHVLRRSAVGERPYNERWFMYVEDLDLCWSLEQGGWRRRLEPDVSIPHVANAAGALAWGDRRVQQWLAATHDWYQLRRGAPAHRLWALVNATGVTWIMLRSLVAAVLPRRRAFHLGLARDMGRALPMHLVALVAGPTPLVRRAARSRSGTSHAGQES